MHRLWLVFSLGQLSAPADSWFARDKVQHFFSSAFVQSVSYASLRKAGVAPGPSLTGASLTTAAVGIGKEIHDRNTAGDFSAKDLTWDAAGAAAVSVLLVRTR